MRKAIPAIDIGSLAKRMSELLDPGMSWKDVEWLRHIWKGTFILKGVLHSDEARRAASEGVDGLIVSNMCSAGFSARASALLNEAWTGAGRSGTPAVIQYMPCAVSEDREAAIAAANPSVSINLAESRVAGMAFKLDASASKATGIASMTR